MALTEFRAENFRCLEAVELELAPDYNLIHGANASGKTSLLEALAYLGRGKSFRGAPTQSVIRHGQESLVVFGRVTRGDRSVSVGVRNGPQGLEIQIGGEAAGGTAALAEVLPLYVIDPDVHNLVAGGPEERRRYLDGVAFHVEHGFLEDWRRFRRALRQRNAALKAGGGDVDAWSRELAEYGARVDRVRRGVVEIGRDSLEDQGAALLGSPIGVEYRQGWADGQALADALSESLERDRQMGSTQVGPHRADLRLRCDERQARRVVSRGQQKLLACALILAATEVVQTHLERPMLLLLDDPAAELDSGAQARLFEQVLNLGSQIVATALEPESLAFPTSPAVFHVERGVLSRER